MTEDQFVARSGSDLVVAAVEASWGPFRAAVDLLSVGDIERATRAGWTAKEMLAHIAFWDEAVEGAVTLLFRGGTLPEGWRFGSGYVPEEPWPRDYVHNAREAAWAREQPAAVVLARLESAHTALLTFLRTVTDAEASDRADYFGELGKHYSEHQPDLDALLMDLGR